MSTNNDSSRRKHLLWIIPAVLAVLLAGTWFGVTLAVENAARRCFAEASCQLFGGEVRPQDVSYSLSGQELHISGLLVENPPGYSQKPAIRVDLIRAEVAPQDLLFKRVVRLKKLDISGISFNMEVKIDWKRLKDSKINLFELEKAASAPGKPSGSRRQQEPLRFRIDELHVEEAKASVGHGEAIPVEWRTFTLKTYEQKDLGREKPLTADEIAKEIYRRHCEQIAGWWGKVERRLSETGRRIENATRDAVNAAKKGAGKVKEKVVKGTKERVDAIKSVWGEFRKK